MTTGQAFWAEGDLCIYESPQSEQFLLGFIKKVDPVTKFCTVQSPLAKSDCYVNAEELYAPTIKQKKGIVQSPLNKSAVLLADAQFFSRKLNKIIGLAPEVVSKNASKSCAKMEAKSPTWSVGDLCICIWSEDNNYYYASISQAYTERNQYLVTFCYYDNEELKHGDELHEPGTDFEMLVEDEQNKAAARNLKVGHKKKPATVREEDVKQAEEKFASALNLMGKKPENVHPALRTDSVETAKPSRLPPTPTAAARATSGHSGSNKSAKNARLPASETEHVAAHPHHRISCMSGDNSSAAHTVQTAISSLAALSNVDQQMPSSAWQALLISWFMCGYHTGFYEALQNHQEEK